MITEDAKKEISDRLKAIATSMPGFRSRPGQRIMIAEVAKAFGRCHEADSPGKAAVGSTVVCVNGGTGIGKSLGYVLAGAVMARRKKKKLVISSSTIALQEQLTQRDLPFFLKAADLPLRVELAKGRTRFVCQYRLVQALGDMQQMAMFGRGEIDKESESASAAVSKELESMADDLMAGRWDGDRDARGTVTDDLWKSVTTDRHGCLNRACPHFRGCAQMAARQRLKDADIIVANHDLVLSDLAMGGGKILPKPEECMFAFDEAHHLPEKAVNVFASSHLLQAEARGAEKLSALAGALSDALGSTYDAVCSSIEEDAERLSDDLNQAHSFFSSLGQLKPTTQSPRPTLEFIQSCIPEEFFSMGANVRSLSTSLADKLGDVADAMGELLNKDSGKKALYEKLLAEVGAYRGRLDEIGTTWTLFLEEPAENAPPVAKWIEAFRVKHGVEFKMCASPVVAAGYLRKLLWEKAAGVILASANLTTFGTFEDFLRRTGLSSYDGVECVDLPSPFDYASQGVLEIRHTASPKDYDAHTRSVLEEITTLISALENEGALVLFTSRRQMDDILGRLPEELRTHVLAQGVMSKSAIIGEHKRRVDEGKISVIFGLESYSEGIDLKGRHCTLVVITKLPFAVPDSPVLRTLSAWIEKRGGNPFMEISVPDAARKLEQRVGRLIRTESDVGRVVVTDPRLWNTKYGRSILRGLPPFRVIAMGKEVMP